LRIIALILVVIMFFTSIAQAGGWIDDWFDSRSSVSPTSLKGQKRGYFTLGSFSGRYRMSNDRLVSVSPPSLKFGCGGIDAFMGGFSFLNPEYLVQKLQNILQAAPAAAFDIALNNLCEPCSKTIKSLEAIADTLNQLQMNDCAMSRALAVKVLHPLAPEKLAAEKAEADKTFNLTKGFEELGHKITQIWNQNPTNPQPTSSGGSNVVGKTTEKCDEDFKALIKEGSVLANFLGRVNSKYSSYVDLMRGYVGDVVISKPSGSENVVIGVVAPCSQNDPSRAQDFLEGKIYKRADGSESCTLVNDEKRSLFDYVHTNIVGIYDKIKKRNSLTSSDESFMAAMPAPLLLGLKVAVATGADDASLFQLSDIMAREYAFMIISDLYQAIGGALYKAEEVYTKARYNPVTCKTEFVDPVVKSLTQFAQRVREFANAVRDDNARVANTYNAVAEIVARYEKQNEVFQRTVRTHLRGVKVP
jgi:conjugative transfer pilus assembly protein TraH